jgi:hypothetical protein
VASPPPQAKARSATGIRAIFLDILEILPAESTRRALGPLFRRRI